MVTTYDAIVVGAGHNGLTLAIYLARAGLSTLVAEQQDTVGGMARTNQTLLPGFRHHDHANTLLYNDLMPHTTVIDYARAGVHTIWPQAQHGLCFRDDRPPLLLYRIDQHQRSHQSIKRFSTRDADTYLRLKTRADTLTTALADLLYSPPDRATIERYRGAAAHAYHDTDVDLDNAHWRTATARQVIDHFFTSPEVRTLMYLLAGEFGAHLGERGSGVAFLGYVLWLIGRRRLPTGGMGSVPTMLRDQLERAGGTVLTDSRVSRITVEAGAATGIEIAGSSIRARHLVASGIGVTDTYRHLLGSEQLDRTTRAAVDAFERTGTPSLASLGFCLREAPDYRATRRDPDINQCLQTFIGLDEPDEVIQHRHAVDTGLLPEPAGPIQVNTLWDRTQAPHTYHTANANCAFPPVAHLGNDLLRGLRSTFTEAMTDRWRTYAPNITHANILHTSFELSARSERKMLFSLGTRQYRSGITGLYLCGCATHPGGGVHAACAYNAFLAIADDLDLNVAAAREQDTFRPTG